MLYFPPPQAVLREEMFVTSKLWNTKHDPEDVEEACRTSLAHLGLTYLDLYLVHWPMAFQWAEPHTIKGNLSPPGGHCVAQGQCEGEIKHTFPISVPEAALCVFYASGRGTSWCLAGMMEASVTRTHTTETRGRPWRVWWIKVWSGL